MVNNVNSKYPALERFDSYPEYGDSRFRGKTPVSPFIARRHRAMERHVTREDKFKAGIGSVVGTVVPMLFMMKKQGVKNPLKLKYGLQDMITLSATSIAGGVAAGMISESAETKKNKLREGVFLFLNAAIPAWVVGGVLKLCETSKKFNNIPAKIASVAAGLIVSMFGAAEISNKVCDPYDKRPDRKLTLKDCLANIDDALGVLVLAKFPCADKLHIERLLPFIYSYCGYRAGKSN